jgi:hypothetical protein
VLGVRTGSVIATFVATLVLLAACGASGSADELVTYQRVWPDGLTESTTVWPDGRVQMKHGDVLERLVLSASDVDRIKTALAKPIPAGSPDDSPKRTLTLTDGRVVQSPRPDPDTVTLLLDNLTSTHTLDG